MKIRINQSICGILTPSHQQGMAPAVLFLHGFASDKDEINSVYTHMANSLNKMNITTLRIDFRCWGESDGKTEQSTICKMIEDTIESIKYLQTLNHVISERIGIVGFSLGAAIAMLSLNHINCKSLALISPALNLKSDFTNFLGKDTIKKLSESLTPLAIDLPWRTIKLSKDYFVSLEKHNPLLTIKSYNGGLYCKVTPLSRPAFKKN